MMDSEVALQDFRNRVAQYELIYEPLGEEDRALSYIKVINVGAQIVANQCGGYVLSQVDSALYVQFHSSS